jgi:hypothetical protein
MIGAENRDLNPFRRKRRKQATFLDLVKFKPYGGFKPWRRY